MILVWRLTPSAAHLGSGRLAMPAKALLTRTARPGCWPSYQIFRRQNALRDLSRLLRSLTAKGKSSTSQWARAMDILISRPTDPEVLVTIRFSFRAAMIRAL